jgi:hypothetical protein
MPVPTHPPLTPTATRSQEIALTRSPPRSIANLNMTATYTADLLCHSRTSTYFRVVSYWLLRVYSYYKNRLMRVYSYCKNWLLRVYSYYKIIMSTLVLRHETYGSAFDILLADYRVTMRRTRGKLYQRFVYGQ